VIAKQIIFLKSYKKFADYNQKLLLTKSINNLYLLQLSRNENIITIIIQHKLFVIALETIVKGCN